MQFPHAPSRVVRAALLPCVLLLPLTACGGGGSGSSGDGDGGAQGAVSIASVSPPVGGLQGGFFATLGGSGFVAAGGTEVFFGTRRATEVAVLDDATLTCRVPSSASVGTVQVRVQNANGTASIPQGFRYARRPIPDFNHDGTPDLAVGASGFGGGDSGAVYIFFGDPLGVADTQGGEAGLKILGPSAASGFGQRLAAGDVNGDGITDLLISAPRHGAGGAVFVFKGPLSSPGTLTGSAADAILSAETLQPGDYFGESLAVGDVSGDGVDDVLVGAVHHDSPAPDNGAVYAFFGRAGFTHASAASASVKLTGRAATNQFGKDLAVGDVDGDGRDDLVVGSPSAGSVRGEVCVFFGGDLLASGSADLADIRITGESISDLFGAAVAVADLNADGIQDVLAGAPGNDAMGASSGAAYAFFGGQGRPAAAGEADAILLGARPGDEFGRGMAAGDVDGDGVADLVVGASRVDAGAVNNGRVYAFLGSASFGDGVASGADMLLTGLAITNEKFGQTIELVDVDGDQRLDICVGSFELGRGDVHVFLGAPNMFDLLASEDAATFTGEVGGDSFGVGIAATR